MPPTTVLRSGAICDLKGVVGFFCWKIRTTPQKMNGGNTPKWRFDWVQMIFLCKWVDFKVLAVNFSGCRWRVRDGNNKSAGWDDMKTCWDFFVWMKRPSFYGYAIWLPGSSMLVTGFFTDGIGWWIASLQHPSTSNIELYNLVSVASWKNIMTVT